MTELRTNKEKQTSRFSEQRSRTTMVIELCIVCVSGVVWLLSLFFKWHILTHCSMLLAFCAFLWIFVRDAKTIILLFPVLFDFTTTIAGVYSIEMGSFHLPELGIDAHFAGSLPSLVFYYLLALLVMYFCIARFNFDGMAFSKSEKTASHCSNLLFAANLFLLFVLVLALKNPFFAFGADRFSYGDISLSTRIVERTVAYGVYLLPFCAVSIKGGWSTRGILCIVLYMMISFLSGNKFGIFLQTAWLLAVFFFDRVNSIDSGSIKRWTLIFCFGVLIIICGTLVHNQLNYGKSFKDNLLYLQQRLAQNGQLWWRTFDLYENDSIHVNELTDECDAWFNSDAEPSTGSYGIYKVMKYSIEYEEIFDRVISHGSRYTNSTSSTMFYYFGFPGLFLFSILMGLSYAWIILLLTKRGTTGDVFRALMLIKFYGLLASVNSMSDFDQLFSLETFAFIAIYLALALCAQWFDRFKVSSSHEMVD